MKILQKLKHKNIVDLVEMITDKEESKAERRRQEAAGELINFFGRVDHFGIFGHLSETHWLDSRARPGLPALTVYSGWP